MEDWLTPEEISQNTGINYHTLVYQIRVGKLAATKRGGRWYVHKDELERFLSAHYDNS